MRRGSGISIIVVTRARYALLPESSSPLDNRSTPGFTDGIRRSRNGTRRGFAQLSAYVASKHGVVGLTKSAALEYATSGIRVNAVCPGVIHTEMMDRVTGKDAAVEKQFVDLEPMGRMGTPREIADAAVWLCSDARSFVTGHALAVDGGLVAR